jgi:hypothetical protein
MHQTNDVLLKGQLVNKFFTETSKLGQDMLTYELYYK